MKKMRNRRKQSGELRKRQMEDGQGRKGISMWMTMIRTDRSQGRREKEKSH